MKKIFLQLITMSALALTANAQNFSVSTQYSYLTGHGANDNHSSLNGVAVLTSFAITDNMAVGTAIHKYAPKKSNYKSGNFSYKATDDVTNVAVSYKITLAAISSIFQPYTGVDIGISTSNHKVEFNNDLNKLQKFNIKKSYVMMSPKVGMNIALNKRFGVYTQAQYNFSPGNGGKTIIEVKNSKSNATITTEPISKYYNIDTGVYMSIGNIK